jgi:hypothetical protein
VSNNGDLVGFIQESGLAKVGGYERLNELADAWLAELLQQMHRPLCHL